MHNSIFITSITDPRTKEQYEEKLPKKSISLFSSLDFSLKMFFIKEDWIVTLTFETGTAPIQQKKASLEKTAREWLKGAKGNRKIYDAFKLHIKSRKNTSHKLETSKMVRNFYQILTVTARNPFKVERKEFPTSPMEWSIYGGFIKAQQTQKAFVKKLITEQDYRDSVICNFYMPLHTAILHKIKSAVLQTVLVGIHKNINGTILEEMSAALFAYHIERDGTEPPANITVTYANITRLGNTPEQFIAAMYDIASLIASVVTITIQPVMRGKKLLYVLIHLYIPRTDCSMETVELHKAFA